MKNKLFEELWCGIKRYKFVLNLLFTLSFSLMQSGFTQLLSLCISYMQDRKRLYAYIFLIFGYILFWELIEYFGDVLTETVAIDAENNTRKMYLKRLYKTSPEKLKDSNSGYIAGLLSKHIENVEYLLGDVFLMGLIALVDMTYAVVVFTLMHTYLGISTFVIFVLGALLRVLTVNRVADKRAEMNKSIAEINRQFMDTVNNMSTVQKLRAITFFDTKLNEKFDANIKAYYRFAWVDEFYFCLYKLVMYMLFPVNLLVCLYLKGIGVELNMAYVLGYITLNAIRMVHDVKYIGRAYKSINSYMISKKQLEEIVSYVDTDYVESTLNKFSKIEIKDVVYHYPGGVTEIKVDNFSLDKGDIVVLYGESGQGKTTTLNILSGAIKSGGVYVDGEKYETSINPSYIAQDVEMFDMSLRDNLCLGNNISDEELIYMLEVVGLGDWYRKQSNGLETLLGERGVKVSTGQRQRLNLIRGLLYDRLIYFLDEPTSNVDDVTEEKIIKLIQDKLYGKTVVIVTHRPKILNICNKLYEFKGNQLYQVK